MTNAQPRVTDDPVTALIAALATDRAGQGTAARDAMRQLEQAWPAWDEPSVRLAESLRSVGELAAAEQAYQRALERNPQRIEALIAFGAAMVARGAGAEAQTLLVQACGLAADNAEAWNALGHALMQTAEPDTAESAFAVAQRLAPQNLEFAIHRGMAARSAGTDGAELVRLELAAIDDPLDPVPLAARAVLLEQDDQRLIAIELLEAATTLAPGKARLWALLGSALGRVMRTREAETALRRACDLDPTEIQARCDLAAALARLHRHAEARVLLEALVADQGENSVLLCNLACSLVSLGLQADAEAMIRSVLAKWPHSALAHRALVNTLPYAAEASGAGLLSALQDCSTAIVRPAPVTLRATEPERRLRLGLLSGLLRTHPVAWLTVAGFEALDPAAFDIICLGPNRTTRWPGVSPPSPVHGTTRPAWTTQRSRPLRGDWASTY